MDKNNEKEIKVSLADEMLGAKITGDGKMQSIIGNGNDAERIGNFDELVKLTEEIRTSSKDYYANINNISIIPDNNNLNIGLDHEKFPFSSWGLSQLCTALEIPTGYIKKCMNNQELDLASHNLNKWLDKLKKTSPNKELLVRTTNNRVHGFLSNRYGVFDDSEITEVIDDVLGGRAQYSLKDFLVNPEMMNVRIINKEKIHVDNEDLSIGFNIRNSRVGQSSIDIQVLLYKWICSNGLMGIKVKGSFYARKHVKVDKGTIRSEFLNIVNSLPQVEEKIIRLIDTSKRADLSEEQFKSTLSRFEGEDFVSKAMAAKVPDLMDRYGMTTWGFTQSLTEMAQAYTYATRENIEKYAGKMLMNV